MGVDCDVVIPAQTNLDNVGEFLGRLFNMPTMQQKLSGLGSHDNKWYVKVDGISQEPDRNIGSGRIFVWENPSTCIFSMFVSYNTDYRGNIGLILPADPIGLAVARRLVLFFGGRADYNDCDSRYIDISRPARYRRWPDDGAAWQKLQQAIFDEKPLTLKEVEAMAGKAAYFLDDADRKRLR